MDFHPTVGGRLLACLSYISLLFLVPLVLVSEDDRFMAFHIRHGFMIFVVTIIGNVILLMLDALAQGYLYPYLGRLFNLAIVVACLYGIYLALRGKTSRIWGISDLLERFPI